MKNPSISFIAPLVAAFAFISSASAASVDKADYNTLDLDTHPQIVTNVTFDGLVTEQDLTNATNGFLKSEGNYANVSNMAMTAVHCVSDESDVSDSGWTLLVSDGESVLTNVSEVVSGNVNNIVTTVEKNSYSVLSLYKDGVKVWTSDPAEQGVGWIVAIVLALVGTGGVATKKQNKEVKNG